MEFDSLIEHVMISPNVLQVKEDYMYLYHSLEAEGLPQNTGDGFNMAVSYTHLTLPTSDLV